MSSRNVYLQESRKVLRKPFRALLKLGLCAVLFVVLSSVAVQDAQASVSVLATSDQKDLDALSSTLRFYERKNLVPDQFVKRDKNNYRIYSEEIIEYLDDVKALLSADFSIEELSLLVNQQINLSYEEKKNIVENKINEIDDLLKRLRKSKKFLSAILEGKANFQTKC
ncbi:MerR family transcriptional regulator [Paenibacillus sp. M1]|uniref:MerR family transcriptional regulator n=1 Tax=Paenibacillus haidiansis TaxID=1574488 RepID=A0ABU7VSB0_9BACL